MTGETLLFERLTELIIRVDDYILRAHDMLRKRVIKAMGGEVLELMRERAERLEGEAEERGIQMGIEQGIERGIEKTITEYSALLRARGVDESVIEETVAALQANTQGTALEAASNPDE